MEMAARTVTEVLGLDVMDVGATHPVQHAYSAARDQYDSFTLLRDVLSLRPKNAWRVLGLTECDLFVPVLSFVFGQAQLGGPAALVSYARLRPEFYGLPPANETLMERAGKTVLHEMGHTFGLTHCADPRCAMALATGIGQLDMKLPRYCADCWSRTQGISI